METAANLKENTMKTTRPPMTLTDADREILSSVDACSAHLSCIDDAFDAAEEMDRLLIVGSKTVNARHCIDAVRFLDRVIEALAAEPTEIGQVCQLP